jgi:uncharacterized membrane protein
MPITRFHFVRKRMFPRMTTAQWLLMFHITGAFLLIGGSVTASVLNIMALRAKRPSETALFLGLVRWALPAIGLGAALTLIFGLWLVHEDGYAFFSFWVLAALVLWVATNALGQRGGKHQTKIAKLAGELAAQGDTPSDELRALLRDPRGNAMSWLAGVASILIIVDMFWKPGA